jgi:acetylornithine/N-succinyldiaminopimelate aminotransferase
MPLIDIQCKPGPACTEIEADPAKMAPDSGIGLTQGLACSGEAEPLRAMLAERGLLTRGMGSFLGLFPPLTVEERKIDAAVSIVDAVCALETR